MTVVGQAGMANQAKYLIISTMKDEGPYILEWLAYHRAIGFTDFLIYTNDCSDGTDLLLDRLAANGIVTHVRNEVLKRGPHKSALKYAKEHEAYKSADWVYSTDPDEFLNIKIGEGKLEDLLDLYSDADAVPVCWRMFSNAGHEKLIEGLTLEALQDAEPAEPTPGATAHFVKTIFRPRAEVERIGTHGPKYSKTYSNDAVFRAPWCSDEFADQPERPLSTYGYDIAQINHYAVRTVDAFLLKRARGDGNSTLGRLEFQYWKRWCRGGTVDTSIQRMLPGTKAELQRLFEDPVVRHLHEAAREVHKSRVAALLDSEDYQGIKNQIMAASVTDETPPPDVGPSIETSLAVKAPRRHENRRKLLGSLPKNGRGAEIGVWNGGFSEHILEIAEPSELILIDPWDLLADEKPEDWTHKKHSQADEMRAMRENVEAGVGSRANVTIRRGFSADVLATYPDDYFDWVYIDGNHLYDFVRQDLELSFQKVRPGGVVAGDDFFWKRQGRMHVREAVLDTMRAIGMLNRPTRFGQQYMIQVPQ